MGCGGKGHSNSFGGRVIQIQLQFVAVVLRVLHDIHTSYIHVCGIHHTFMYVVQLHDIHT